MSNHKFFPANIVAQSTPSKQSKGRSPQLNLFATSATGLKLKAKSQISSIPGVFPKDPKRYRVKLRNEILGDRLTLDEALALAKRGGR